jgi:hypothetical protein
MVQAQSKKLTFDGELIALPPESEPNNFIANYSNPKSFA